jgi:hypothetical protein
VWERAAQQPGKHKKAQPNPMPPVLVSRIQTRTPPVCLHSPGAPPSARHFFSPVLSGVVFDTTGNNLPSIHAEADLRSINGATFFRIHLAYIRGKLWSI